MVRVDFCLSCLIGRHGNIYPARHNLTHNIYPARHNLTHSHPRDLPARLGTIPFMLPIKITGLFRQVQKAVDRTVFAMGKGSPWTVRCSSFPSMPPLSSLPSSIFLPVFSHCHSSLLSHCCHPPSTREDEALQQLYLAQPPGREGRTWTMTGPYY
jgi:hypothetical protein